MEYFVISSVHHGQQKTQSNERQCVQIKYRRHRHGTFSRRLVLSLMSPAVVSMEDT